MEKTSEKTEKKEILPVKDQTLNTSHTLLWWLYGNIDIYRSLLKSGTPIFRVFDRDNTKGRGGKREGR